MEKKRTKIDGQNKLFCGWQHESYRLIRGQKPSFERKEMEMRCCRNDFAAASLVLQHEERIAVQLENHAEFYPQWNYPWGSFLVICAEVDCPGLPGAFLSRVQMHPDDDLVHKGDALFDWGSEIVSPWTPIQLFLCLNAGADTAPGRYDGAVRLYAHRMFEDEEPVETLPFTVEVADVVLPSGAERKFHLVIWQHLSNIARHHQVPLFSDRHFRLLEDYTRALSEMGNVAATVAVGDIPWAGQTCYRKQDPPSDLFEYNIVRITRDREGVFHYDYSALRRYLELCRRYDMAREVHLFGLVHNWANAEYGNITEDYPDPIRLRYLDEADGCAKFMRKAADIKDYISSLYSWLEKEGWLPRCCVAPDEPTDMEALGKSMRTLREAAPDFKIQADYDPFFIQSHPELRITSYVPEILTIAESEAKEPGIIRRVMERCDGKKLWYTCCWPMTPNTFLGSPLLEGRLIALVTEWLGLDGFSAGLTPAGRRTRYRMARRWDGLSGTHFSSIPAGAGSRFCRCAVLP